MGTKVTIGEEEVVIDPQLLFQRLLIIANSIDIGAFELWEYELSIHPLAIITKNGQLRIVHDKANLTSHLTELCKPESVSEDKDLILECTVLDMGSILHKVPWKKGDTYGKIIDDYVKRVKCYPGNCFAVFDGYNEKFSTKHSTHLHRSKKLIPSHKIELARHLPFSCESKEAFLANKINKQAFIDMLSDALNDDQRIKVLHAKDDADLLIANTAINCAIDKPTQVVCEDADIFQLLINKLNVDSKPIYMVTDKGGAKNPCININAIRAKLGDEYAKFLPVLHAISGCDTTSRLHGIGKITVLNKSEKIFAEARPFLSPDATPDEIENAGRRILCLIYDGRDNTFDLNKIRKRKFEKNVIKSLKHVDIQVLPPTNDAAKYHSFRVYHQVQVWQGNENLKPTEWGWKEVNDQLFPRTMDKAPAPDSLMKIIKCGCTLNCDTNKCTCKKHGLFCTDLCENCNEGNCINVDISDAVE